MKRATLRTVHVPANNREPFNCNGTLRGTNSTYRDAGRLPSDYHNDWNKALKAEDFYVIHSYATPIAWYAYGEWTVPAVKYSRATSRQLNALRLPR